MTSWSYFFRSTESLRVPFNDFMVIFLDQLSHSGDRLQLVFVHRRALIILHF